MLYREAIGGAIRDMMAADPAVIVLGAGVADPKGIFGTTKPARKRFPKRVIETPLSEGMLTGALVGMSLAGLKPIYVHARADFAFLTFEHLVNTAAKWRETHGSDKPLPMAVRMLVGRGWGQGPQHSQTVASMLAHVPGLRILMPVMPGQAYAALKESLQGIPTVILEQRRFYENKGDLEPAWMPLVAQPSVTNPWPEAHIVAMAGAWPEALAAQAELSTLGINVSCICIQEWPFPVATLVAAVRDSGRLVVADTDWVESGLAAEVVSVCAEAGVLTAPPVRVGPPRTACPTAANLEAAWYPSAGDIGNAVLRVLTRKPVLADGQSVVRDGRKEPF